MMAMGQQSHYKCNVKVEANELSNPRSGSHAVKAATKFPIQPKRFSNQVL